jgi:hypothetical protein
MNVDPCWQIQWRALDEINSGVCDGMTYEEIKKIMPEEYEYVVLSYFRNNCSVISYWIYIQCRAILLIIMLQSYVIFRINHSMLKTRSYTRHFNMYELQNRADYI